MTGDDLERLRRVLASLSKQRLERHFVGFDARDGRLIVQVDGHAGASAIGQEITLLRLLAEAFGAREALTEIAPPCRAKSGTSAVSTPPAAAASVIDIEGARRLARSASKARGR